ncbi:MULTISPECIES: response regulator [unclassified Marinovum]
METLPNILVVDDHRDIRQSVARYLERNGFQASMAADTAEMDSLLAGATFDLIVLDVMMPGEDGVSACKRLRDSSDIPILMLTALDGEDDLVTGFGSGADDYLSKPFSPRELLVRIQAILRRAGKRAEATDSLAGKTVSFGGVVYDVDARQIRAEDGRHEILTSGEAKLLCILIIHAREVLSRDDLLMKSTGRVAGPMDRTIDNQISRLRKKIEPDVLRPRIIATIRNGGYSLTSDVEIAP